MYRATPNDVLKMLVTDEKLWKNSIIVAERNVDDALVNLCQLSAFLINFFCVTDSGKTTALSELKSSKTTTLERRIVNAMVTTFIAVDFGENFQKEALAKELLSTTLPWLKDASAPSIQKICACNVIAELALAGNVQQHQDMKELASKILTLLPSKESNFELEESATKAVGALPIGLDKQNVEFQEYVLDHLATHGAKIQGITYHFTLGDTMACVLVRSPMTFQRLPGKSKDAARTAEDSAIAKRFVEKILSTYIVHSKKSIRNAAAVWMLCILKHCHAVLTEQDELLLKVQYEIMRLMNSTSAASSDTQEKETTVSLNTDVTEDIVPKCLHLLYTAASSDAKQKLMKELGTFLNMASDEGKQNSQTLLAMRELLQLSTDFTDNGSNFYEFMNVISYHKWGSGHKSEEFFKSRRSESDQLNTNIAQFKDKLIPPLFLLTCDPLQLLRSYFTIVWEVVTKEEPRGQLLLKYVDSVLDVITSALDDPLWRRREAACVALSSVLGLGASAFKERIGALADLLEHCFRVMDDMKESVRLKAEITLKALFKVRC